MSEPRDLRLERLNDRDGLRPPYAETAHVGAHHTGTGSTRLSQAAYEALIDAVFTAPGVSAWLSGLRRALAAMFADKDSAQHPPAREATPAMQPRLWRP
jgi:hypothetical protein